MKNYEKFLKKFRKGIPKNRNQVLMLDHLTNDDITFYINITNRTDGKTFQYLHFLIEFQRWSKVGFTLLCRHYDLRQSYIDSLEEIFKIKNLGSEDLTFLRRNDYTQVFYKELCIGIIVELLNATDLKHYSNFLKDFPIIYFDELLVTPMDYLGNEWELLKTIYQSIDRNPSIPIINKPKIIMAGNPINFESDILFHLKLFNSLEKNQMGKCTQVHKKTMILMEHNKDVDKLRNMNAFSSIDDDNQDDFEGFYMNKHLIVNDHQRNIIMMKGKSFVIEINEYKVKIFYWYNEHTSKYEIFLSLLNKFNSEKAMYYENIKDIKKGGILLDDKYKKDMTKKYKLGLFKFDNVFSKNTLTENNFFINVNLVKCITKHKKMTEKEQPNKEKIFNDNHMLIQSKNIKKRFL